MAAPDVYNMRWPASQGGEHSVYGPDVNEVGGVYKLIDDGKHMVQALGHNEFSRKIRDVPVGVRMEELNDSQRDYFCRDARPEPELDGLEVWKWKDRVRSQCLTIQDVLELKQGEEIKVLVMDRNLGDTCCEINPGNSLFSATEFFRDNWAIYTHDKDLQGKIKYSWQDHESYRNDPECKNPYDFEFQIEYKKDCWYPLKNGSLPGRDPQGFAKFGDNGGKHWSQFPKNTRVGWRGPMLLWRKLEDQPDVYWYER